MINKKNIIFLLVLFFLIVFFNTALAAAPNLQNAVGNIDTTADQAGFKTEQNLFFAILSTFITMIFSLLGIIFMGLLIYGGFLWMTAKGNEEQVTKAKNLLTAAVIGLIIILSAYAISYFVIYRLGVNSLKQST